MSTNEIAPGHTGPVDDDSIYSVCCVCFLPMFFNRKRDFPDYWCQRCYYQFKDQLAEDWMKYLVRVEHARRMRLGRRRRRGDSYDVVSYDALKDQMRAQEDPEEDYEADFGGYGDPYGVGEDADTAADD